MQAYAAAANHTSRAFYTLIAKGVEAMFWATPPGTICMSWLTERLTNRLLIHNVCCTLLWVRWLFYRLVQMCSLSS